MASLLQRLFGERTSAPARETPPREEKASRAAGLIAHMSMGLARWTPRNYVELTRLGFERNPIAYRSVRLIAESAASIPWRAYSGREELPDHPLLKLLSRPNPIDVAPTFFEALYSNLLLFGNAYVEAALVGDAPRELYVLRSDRMSVVPGRNGWPEAYDYMVAGEKVRYAMSERGVQPILQLKLYHPLDDHYGFAPLGAAQMPLDVHNAASGWTKALLDNSARPSGALVYAGPQGSTLSDEQFERLKAELEESFSGPRNAGRPLLLEGGLDWKALSLSPKDMDFMQAKADAAREIALAFGVPPLMLGIPGDNTFSNYQEANRAFWRQTVIPLVARTQCNFAAWLKPAFGDITLDYDVDRIDALAEERAAEWTRLDNANFLTIDEKREAAGYGKAPEGAATAMPKTAKKKPPVEMRYAPDQPRAPAGTPQGGQWTGGGGSRGASSQTTPGAPSNDAPSGDASPAGDASPRPPQTALAETGTMTDAAPIVHVTDGGVAATPAPATPANAGQAALDAAAWSWTIFGAEGAPPVEGETSIRTTIDVATGVRADAYKASDGSSFTVFTQVNAPVATTNDTATISPAVQTANDPPASVQQTQVPQALELGGAASRAFQVWRGMATAETLAGAGETAAAAAAAGGLGGIAILAVRGVDSSMVGDASSAAVGSISDERVRAVCPDYPLFDAMAKNIAANTSADGLSPQQYGTAVHTQMAAEVNAMRLSGREDVWAEYSVDPNEPDRAAMNSPSVPYGTPGSSRLDIYQVDKENQRVCVYDIYTGGGQKPASALIRQFMVIRAREVGFDMLVLQIDAQKR